MKISIIGRKCSPRENFKERAEKKLAKVERILGQDVEAKITVTVEKSEQIVEVTLIKNGMIFRAEESAANMNDALDRCVDALMRQIRKNKTRLEKRMHSGDFSAFAAEEEPAEEANYEVVRTKTVALKPQSVEEAILQMNLLGHQFYLFLNSETENVSLVYQRKGGGYGLLEPEAE